MALPENFTTTGTGEGSSSTSSAQRDPIIVQLEQIKALLQQQSQTLDAHLAQQLQKDVDIDRRRVEKFERDEHLRAQVMNGWVLEIAEYEALLRYIRQEHEDRKAMIQSVMSECRDEAVSQSA
ncbi:hypothetical protein PLEOSDRAFT_169559 [Pleurotus ostreatus PC15]|uniref:Uncharacterized protein n=1 Tax=Pleurotus ostreatus (strain PC15) TaxID=1137138 RepID=A0A067NN70_PLEO1|nr:hypothetical protein PLEOSDRAFT_169559 [Pleurotus ostreatus PC15]